MSGIPLQRECCGWLGIASRPGLPHPVLHGTYRDAIGVVRLRHHQTKNDLLRLLPLPVLCALYAAFPAWGEAVAVLQSVHLVVLIGWYTPLFYKEYDNLNCCCWDAVNETPNDVAPDYDCLPESMPWIGRRYTGLLVITLLALLAHFLPYGWTAYVMAVLLPVTSSGSSTGCSSGFHGLPVHCSSI